MTIDQLLDQAEGCHRAGRLDDAVALYQKALMTSPGHADAEYGLGTVLMRQNKGDEALGHLTSAVTQLPNVPEFQFNLALCLVKVGRIEDAKSALLRAAALAGNNIYFLIPICTKMVELGLAGQAYNCLVRTGDQSPKVRILKAKALGAAGNWRGAARALTALADENPDDPVVWFEHAKAASFLRNYDAALASFRTYMTKKEPSAEDYLSLADLLLTARQPEAARAELEKAVEGGIDRAEAHHLAAKCARLEGDKAGVRKFSDLAIERRPTFGHAWQLKFEVSAKDELAELAETCTRLVDADGATEWDRIMLDLTAGRAFEKLEQFSDAFSAFERGNLKHKALLAKRNSAYDKDAIVVEHDKIIGHFPTGGDYAVAPESDGHRPIFILGMPRSGTTLVEKILACLNGVEAGGENEALEFVAAQYYWDLAQGRAACPTDLEPEQLAALAESYWQKTVHSQPVVTDKMPHNFRHVGLACQMFPDARVIYMRRDPRDVCLSIFSRPFADAHRYSVDLDWLAHFYAENMRLKDHWKSVFPAQVLEVVYEDLVDDPLAHTQAIAEFCGLEWHEGCLEFHKQQGTSFTFSELQVRKPLNKEGIGRWRSYEAQLAPLEKALEAYGVFF
ncbi:tetratricopeptide repeat-containing sulfotransferase family protein [Kordiimonas lacus]|uniref:TPR repeat-containing protein n=1 Tax=Kordiimonas lacus TaxID=637679 RepID=A0A1G6UR94_9PROT|nr:tetratricopeptide repeat-containing sulfotransferase family protein [Kordiimonas lacus]SDD43764.1 TPR repeat-containing protein [Kordiimonas lacus]